ncbi:MAG TPA: hypothetical protein VFH22_00405 [Rhodocyclaceae bacterium]|nr:hypothetical protein [Rhodocyclaceae bacterium]
MKHYHFVIAPIIPTNGAARASVFATQMAERQRHKGKGRQQSRLEDWEDEGGTVASPTLSP